jgi:hypothetical protein
MALSRRDRLRRVVLLCSSFTRNLAYYQAGKQTLGQRLLDERAPHTGFWRQVNSNCIDLCALDWCKLFADGKGEHHWSKVVADIQAFESGLLGDLGLNVSSFDNYTLAMKTYRNKFVAHLDRGNVMNIPDLGVAQKAVWFLHPHIVAKEAKPGDLGGLEAVNLQLGYDQCVADATEVFRSAPMT